jgi:hypothetical protein
VIYLFDTILRCQRWYLRIVLQTLETVVVFKMCYSAYMKALKVVERVVITDLKIMVEYHEGRTLFKKAF